MFLLNFYQIAYIDKLIVFPSISTSFPCSARAESNSDSGIFTNILHSKWKYIRVKGKYVNAMQLKDSYRLYRALYSQQQLFILYCLDFKVLYCLGLLFLKSIFIETESILLLDGYVCFSKISVALYLHQYDICK